MRRGFYKRRDSAAYEWLGGARKRTIELLSNKYVAFAFVFLVLSISYYIAPELWKYIVSALITYFAAALVMRYSLRYGLFRPGRSGRSGPAEGHAFVWFIFIIIATTFASNLLVGYMEGFFLRYTQEKWIIVLIQTVIILALLLIDMGSEF